MRVSGVEGQLAGRDGILQANAQAKMERVALVDHAGRAVFATHQSGRHLEIAPGWRSGQAKAQTHLQAGRIDVWRFAFSLE